MSRRFWVGLALTLPVFVLAMADMLPGLGEAVSGASWTPYDGHVNSLALFHALHRAIETWRDDTASTVRSGRAAAKLS